MHKAIISILGRDRSGIVAAVSDNDGGIAGTCWGCRIMAVRVGFADPAGFAWLEADDAAAGIAYLISSRSFMRDPTDNTARTLLHVSLIYLPALFIALLTAVLV